MGPDQGFWIEGEKERGERPACLGGPDGRNKTQIAIIYFGRPVITEPESLRTTEFLLGSKPHAAEVNIQNVKKGLTDVKKVHKPQKLTFGSSLLFVCVFIGDLCDVEWYRQQLFSTDFQINGSFFSQSKKTDP